MNTTFRLQGAWPEMNLEVRMMPGFYLLHLNISVWSFHSNLSYHLHHRVKEKIWELFLLEVWRERAWGPGETRVGAFNGVLKLAHTGSWELMVNISQLCIQWHHIDSLKLAGMGEFIPQKLANSTNQGLFFSPSGIQLWNIYQHNTAYDLQIQVICLPHT